MQLTANDVWTSRDGTETRIRDMTTRHLKHAIAYIERRIEGELNGEGGCADMSDDAISGAAMASYEEEFGPYADAMQEELARRENHHAQEAT